MGHGRSRLFAGETINLPEGNRTLLDPNLALLAQRPALARSLKEARVAGEQRVITDAAHRNLIPRLAA